MSRARRVLRWWWLPLLLPMVLMLLTLALLASESGSAWLLQQAFQFNHKRGLEISFNGSKGTLLGNMQLKDLRYHDAGSQVEIDQLFLHWHPSALLQWRLHIRLLEAQGIRASLAPSEPAGEQPLVIPDLKLPLAVQVDQLLLSDLQLTLQQTTHHVGQVALSGSLDADRLSIDELLINTAHASLQAGVTMQAQHPHQLTAKVSAQLDTQWTHPQVGPLSAQLQISGPALQPGFDVSVQSPAPLQIQAKLDLERPRPVLQLQAHWQALQWPLHGAAELTAGPGTLQLQGAVQDYQLELNTSVSSEYLPTAALQLNAQGDGDLQQFTLEQATLTVPGSGQGQKPRSLELHGVVQIEQPHFDLVAQWAELHWPLRETPAYITRNGRLALQGNLDHYQLQLHGWFAGSELPASRIKLQAAGTAQALSVEQLQVFTLDGELAVQGQLAWEPLPRWQLQVQSHQINPGLRLPDWPGRIDAQLQISGNYAGEGKLQLDTRIDTLHGKLREQALTASGGLQLQGSLMKVQELNISAGQNRLLLDGEAGQHLNLHFDINAPSLATLYPDLSGSLIGDGTILGSRDHPQLQASLRGEAMAYRDLRSRHLQLQADWLDQGGNAVLELKGLHGGALAYSQLTATLQGKPAAHRLQLSASGEDTVTELDASGGWSESEWRGLIQQLQLTVPGLPGQWSLLTPARLQLARAAIHADPLCLAQAGARLCAEGSWTDKQGLDAQARIQNFELAPLSAQLPGEAIIDGQLQGELHLAGSLDRPRADFELRPEDGRIQVQDETQGIEIGYSNARIRGQFADDTGSAELGFTLDNGGQASGELRLGSASAGSRRVDGKLVAEFPDLSLVSGFVPSLEQVGGQLQLSTRLSGTLDAPRLAGLLNISKAEARLPATGIDLTDIELSALAEGDKPLQVQGQARSGDGTLNLAGSVDPGMNSGVRLDLSITGENFQAARLPEVRLQISPNLRLRGSAPYHLSGELLIPKADITLREIPSSAVAVSADEIVVGEAPAVDRVAGNTGITASVRVELGNQVHFKGFGLSTELVGNLDTTVNNDSTTSNGKIELRNGRYRAYGQDLQVQRGRLLFAGPTDNPDIDLLAVRTSLDTRVKAYLALSGPLHKPQARIYSEPPLAQEEALAYLLTGSGLDRANQQQGLSISSAALSLGLSKSEPWIQDLSERLGLDVLQLEAGDNGLQDSSLIIGKYLSPDLYLGYSQDLFDVQGAVLLRLNLNENVELETRSGDEQSVDLYYRVERD